MKTITISAQGLSGGGAERVAALIANYFDKEGYKVYFLAGLSPKREYKLNDSIEYKYIGNRNGLGIVSNIIRMIKTSRHMKRTESDTIISFLPFDNFLLCFNKKYKKILSLRNDPNSTFKSWFKKYRTIFVYERSDYVVFQTEDARDYFNSKIREKGRIIYNPLTGNLPYWREESHEKTVVTACRLEPQKNLKMLIDAFAIFYEQHPDYKLKIFGEGSQRDFLDEYISSIELENAVKLCGTSNMIFDEYLNAEIFALSSDYEGMSNSMLEALAIGVPVVCTDCPCGGARTFIESYTNGILTRVGDTKEFAEALCNMADDEELREKVSHNSVKIREELNVDNVCRQWKELVES